ncbi:MAG: DUF192 domain-containing protein [Sphingomonadales bacterium]|nr:DUF192 domain-containing protein [Sphingomonadales bacterium]
MAAMILAATLGACSSQAKGSAHAPAVAARAVHPVSGLRVIDLTVMHAGKAHRFRVEVAQTPEQQERGLMFRTAMGPDEGMIFPMPDGRYASFWMKNTVIPLDIIFIGLDHRILNIAAGAKPYDETPLYSAGPVSGVLELNGGRAAQLGIGPGDAVGWQE